MAGLPSKAHKLNVDRARPRPPGTYTSTMVVKAAVVACALLLALSTVAVSNQLLPTDDGSTTTYAYNVSSCPGWYFL